MPIPYSVVIADRQKAEHAVSSKLRTGISDGHMKGPGMKCEIDVAKQLLSNVRDL